MKKFFYTLIGVAIIANAGVVSAQGQFSVRAGMNVASGYIKYGGIKQSYDSKVGFHAGVAYEMPLGKTLPLFLDTGLYGSAKGGAIDYGDSGKETMSLFYLQLPVMVGYKFGITDNIALKPAAGLYLGYGASGKAKSDGYSYDLFKKDEDGYQALKPFDMGIRLGVGADIATHYYVGLGYEIGLANISNEGEGETAKINCFTLTVGYNF